MMNRGKVRFLEVEKFGVSYLMYLSIDVFSCRILTQDVSFLLFKLKI